MLPHTSLKKQLMGKGRRLTIPLHNSLPVTFLAALPEMFLLITAPSHHIALPLQRVSVRNVSALCRERVGGVPVPCFFRLWELNVLTD